MDFLKDFLSAQAGPLAEKLTGQLGFGPDQAQRFVPAAARSVFETLKSGRLDLAGLLGGGDPAAVVAEVDTQALAETSGVDEAKASAGVAALVPTLLGALRQQAGGAQGALALLGGDAGGLLGKASQLGGFFKK